VTSRSGDDAPSTVVRAVSEDDQGQGALRALAPAITILWHYDPNRVGKSAPLDRHRTEVSRQTAPFDLDVDSAVSRAPFLIVEQRYGFVTLTPAGTRTSILVDGVPFTTPQDIEDQVLRRGVILTLADRIVICLHQVRTPVERGPELGFVGGSDVMEDVRRQIRDVADSDVSVLIRGASGTGKELVARAIAKASATPTPFVDVNLAERGSTMVASELFGHQKGAFTGATAARAGYFAEADGGTLFIDEVGDLPLDVQAMLLRVVLDGVVRPIGGGRRKVRVRLLTATDKDLEAAVASGTFRAQLLTRIRGCRIDLPTLASRREDIGSLFLHFLKPRLEAAGELHRLAACPPEKRQRPWLRASDFLPIARAAYPGNLRDLESLANEIVLHSRGKPYAVIGPSAQKILTAELPPSATTPAGPSPRRSGQPTTEAIRDALRRHHNNLSATVKDLGIGRTTLFERMQREPSLLRSADDLTDEEILDAKRRHQGDIQEMAAELGVSPKPLKTRLVAALKRRR
jgi:two-component system, NtrC family, nitrogen regulation response regulator GlnG